MMEAVVGRMLAGGDSVEEQNLTNFLPPQLILAGAGTGKTTTITAKSAHMDECGIFDKSRIGARYCVAVRGYVERRKINI